MRQSRQIKLFTYYSRFPHGSASPTCNIFGLKYIFMLKKIVKCNGLPFRPDQKNSWFVFCPDIWGTLFCTAKHPMFLGKHYSFFFQQVPKQPPLHAQTIYCKGKFYCIGFLYSKVPLYKVVSNILPKILTHSLAVPRYEIFQTLLLSLINFLDQHVFMCLSKLGHIMLII